MISSTMPRAISRSPMMTVFAPSFLRCTTSSSECARAITSIFGFAVRARRIDLSRLEGVRDGQHQSCRAGQVGERQHVRARRIAADRLDLISASFPSVLAESSITTKPMPSLRRAFANQASDAAIADQHDMVGETRRPRRVVLDLGRRRPGRGEGAGLRRRPCRACRHRLRACAGPSFQPWFDPVDQREHQRVEDDRQDRRRRG